ncbi:MAG: hypothetical protein Q8N09_10795 [Thermodesulfovibrionia bacterium]|nr:hypothetical protein [Thermodesulfovibrionia bacterium]
MQKKFLKRLEDIFTAIAFAEEGDVETAREILKEERYPQKKIAERKAGIAKPLTLTPSEKPSHL